MDSQTTLNPKRRHPPLLARDAAEVARDVAALADLQARLLLSDLRAIRAGLTQGVALQAVGGALALSALPVTIAGLGVWLSTWEGVSLAGGLLLAGLLAVFIASVLVWAGWRLLKQQSRGLARSRDELAQNLRLLKSVLLRSRGSETDDW